MFKARYFIFIPAFLAGLSAARMIAVFYPPLPTYVAYQVKNRPPALFRPLQTSDDDKNFYDIAILDNGRMWAVDGAGGQPPLYYSDNNGITWQKKNIPGYIRLGQIHFDGNERGWASGKDQILQTVDGGESWRSTNLKTNVDLSSLSFYSRDIGYAGGGQLWADCRGCDFHWLPVEIWKTSDGGENWKRIFKSGKYLNLFDLRAISENVALAIADGKTVLRTTDGGRKWTEVLSVDCNSFSESVNGKIWLVGGKNTFLFSTDEGLTWQTPANFPEKFLAYEWTDIKFADEMRGVAIDQNGRVIVTNDGGNSWNDTGIKTINDHLSWVHFKGDHGVIVGQNLMVNFSFPK